MPKTRTVDGHTVVLDYASPRISSEFYECALPLTFDQYNKCAFNCQYCFAAFISEAHAELKAKRSDGEMSSREASKYRNAVSAVDPDRVKSFWLDPARHRRGSDAMIANLIARRTPVHWGGLCDPFDPFEARFKIGLELMEFWRGLDWPVVFSTKGSLMTQDPWASVLRGGNFRFQFSITGLDVEKSKVSDSGVAPPLKRFEAMRFVAKDLGLVTTLRLRPIIPGFVTSEECCEMIRMAHAAGATGVSTEFFCLEMRGEVNRAKYERMSAAVGFDLLAFYRRNSPGQAGYLRLNRAYKETFFLPMARTAMQLGMRFSVSDKEFKELGNVGGCCGIYWDDETDAGTRDGHAPVFLNRGTVTYATLFARDHGRVRWADVGGSLRWADEPVNSAALGGTLGSSAKRSASRDQTLTDLLRCWWNQPNHAKSLYRYTGGKLVPDGLDADGDVVYAYVAAPYDDETRGCGGGAPCGFDPGAVFGGRWGADEGVGRGAIQPPTPTPTLAPTSAEEDVVVGGLRFYVRSGSSDIKSIREVVEKRAYRRKGFELDGMAEWVDLGANVGAFTVLVASLGCRVTSYEPDPDNFALLERNVALNGFEDRVNLVRAAVVAHAGGTATLHVNGARKNFWRNSLIKAWRGGSSVQVPTVHFGDLLHVWSTAGLKVDTEGSEMPLLEALTTRPSPRLVFEWSFDIDGSIPRFQAVITKLRGWYTNVTYGKFDESTPTWRPEWFPPCRTVWCW